MKKLLALAHNNRRDQKGLASIVVVAILVVILTLVSIGFARIMNRAIQNSTDKELSSAASYAAESGINDAMALLKNSPASPNFSATNCTSILGTGNDKIDSNFTHAGTNAQYTCILVNKTPKDLLYGELPPNKSQVVKMTTSVDVPSSFLFSWKLHNTNGPAANVAGCTYPKLFDQKAWNNNNCEPIMRLTLYPIKGNAVPTQVDSHTYFLYPSSAFNAADPNNTFDYSTPTGSLIQIKCDSNPPNLPLPFNGTAYDCNAFISVSAAEGLNPGDYFYARLTPLYKTADVRIQAANVTGLLKFFDVQSDVDVTAKVSTNLKRLDARVDLGGLNGNPSDNISPNDDGIAEYGLQSAKAICKRLEVGATTTTVDPNATVCNEPSPLGPAAPPPPPPVINMCGYDPVTDTTCTLSTSDTTLNPPGGHPITVLWNITGPSDNSCNTSGSSAVLNFTGPSGNGSGSFTSPPLGGPGTYGFSIRCSSSGGTAGPTTVLVNSQAPTGCTSNCGGCTSNCGGSGGGSLLGFQFDGSKPGNDAFLISFQNVAFCTVTSPDDGLNQGIWAPPSDNNVPYDFGAGSAQNAHIDCYDGGSNPVGSLDANRGSASGGGGGGGGGNCAYYPIFDGWDNIDCVGEVHVHTDPFGYDYHCYNPTGSQEGAYCQ